MAILVPEIAIFNTMNSILKFIEVDYQQNAADHQYSFLYRILGGVVEGKHNYYDEAVDLFIGRGEDHPRRIKARLFFDAQQASVPTIHVTMPQEMQAGTDNTIGVSEDPNETYTNPNTGQVTPNRARSFDTTFYVVVSSDNHREVLIIYHVLQAALISTLAELDLMGLDDIHLSGQDIQLNENIAPNIYMRGIGLKFTYDVSVPRFFAQQLISTLTFTGLPTDPNQPNIGVQSQVSLNS